MGQNVSPSDIPQPLYHTVLGQGPRKVLALHCTIAYSGAWRGVAKCLPDCSFVAPDMLSHGQSPDWDRQGDFPDRMLQAVRPLLTERMDVVGHSFGGTLALRLAVAHPDLVRSLTMIEPVFFAIAEQDDPIAFQQEAEDMRPVMEAFDAGDDVLAARRFNRMWGADGGARWDDLPDRARQSMVRGIHVVRASKGAVTDRARLLADGRLAEVTMPSLLIRGSRSHPIVPAVNEGLARRLPDAVSVTVEGAGHMVPISHPRQTAAHLQQLWARAG